MKHLILFTFLSLFLTSCFDAPESFEEEEIHGTWIGLSYEKEQGGAITDNPSSIGFLFSDDKTYKGVFGEQVEEGVYRVEGNKLYTTAKGLAEKNVELQYVSQDTMVMKMNRVGVIEILTLGKDLN
jgi:hypothetical protein